jgi:hypothetical protein
MSALKDRPESSFVIGLIAGFVAMGLMVAALLAWQMRSGYYGIKHVPLPHATPHYGSY